MSIWLGAAAVLMLMLVPCGLIASRGDPFERLLGFELGGPIGSMALIALAEGFGRSVYFDLALVFALVNLVATLAYVRLLERSV